MATYHSWPPSECIEDPEFCLKSFAESSGELYIPTKCKEAMNSAETEVNQKVLSLKPNQTLLDIYPLENAEDECNEAKLPGLYCHPLRVNSTISGTTRLLCPRIESCEPPEACLSKNRCNEGYVDRYPKDTFEGDRCLEGHSELPGGESCYAPRCSECNPLSHFRLEGECTPCPTVRTFFFYLYFVCLFSETI